MSRQWTSRTAVSIGMLRGVEKWPDVSMPDWANTAAVRMKDMGVTNSRIKDVITEMEMSRRKDVRNKLGSNVPVTEFDLYLADLLMMFEKEQK